MFLKIDLFSVNMKKESKTGLRTYLDDIGKNELLTKQDEIELAKEIEKGNDSAKERLITSNLRLVIKIAKGYRQVHGFNEKEFGDLIQEGNLGLIKAVDKFDYRKKVKFSTYASWWINQSIRRAIKSPSMTWGGFNTTYRVAELANKIPKISNEFIIKYNHEPSHYELLDFMLEKTRESEKRIKSAVEFSRVVSLDSHLVSSDNQIGRLIEVTVDERECFRPEEMIAKIEYREKIAFIEQCLEKISKIRDSTYEDIIRIRYCLFDEKIRAKYNLTDEKIKEMRTGKNSRGLVPLEKTGWLMNISLETVRQKELKALNFLREEKERSHYFSSSQKHQPQ